MDSGLNFLIMANLNLDCFKMKEDPNVKNAYTENWANSNQGNQNNQNIQILY